MCGFGVLTGLGLGFMLGLDLGWNQGHSDGFEFGARHGYYMGVNGKRPSILDEDEESARENLERP